jgi:hypothetical protein
MSPVGRRKFAFDGAHDLEDGQPLGEQLVAVQVHGDLTHLAAVDRRRRHAAQTLDLGLDDVVGEIVELPLVEVAARHGDQGHRDVRQVVADDERLLDAPRQRVQDLLDALDHLGLAVVDVGAPVHPHPHGRQPLARLGLDEPHVADRAHGLLDRVGDRLLDVEHPRTRVHGADVDDRQVDIRKEIDGQPAQRDEAEDDDGERGHENGDGISQSEERHPHMGPSRVLAGRGVSSCGTRG